MIHRDCRTTVSRLYSHADCTAQGGPWGAQIKKLKNMLLLKFDFREILFYKYCTILKKNLPPPGPPLDTRNS